VEPRDRRTRGEGRTAAAPRLSAGVSDEAGPPGPPPAEGPLTTTPAHASPRRPSGAGIADARRSTTASCGLICGGGPGGQSARMGAVPASTGSGEQTSSRRAWPPFSRRSSPTDGLGAPGRRRCGGSLSPHRTAGNDRSGCRPSGIGWGHRRVRSCSRRALQPTSNTPRPAVAHGVVPPQRCRSSTHHASRMATWEQAISQDAWTPETRRG
jgi:hypothetical protein